MLWSYPHFLIRIFLQIFLPQSRSFFFAAVILGGSSAYLLGQTSRTTPYMEGEKAERALVQKELERRQKNQVLAQQALEQGNLLRKSRKWKEAAQRLEFALRHLSPRGTSLKTYQKASQALAAVRYEQAKLAFQKKDWRQAAHWYQEALALDPSPKRYHEGLTKARHQLQQQQTKEGQGDFEKNHPELTPEFLKKWRTIQRLFYEAERLADTGQYQKAEARYLKILALDPYNTTARKLQEKLEKKKLQASKALRKFTREEALYEVTRSWSETSPVENSFFEKTRSGDGAKESNLSRMIQKLEQIVLPQVHFDQLDIAQVLDFLGKKSIELDPTQQGPRGVNFVLKLNPTERDSLQTGEALSPEILRQVTLNLRQVPLIEVLKFISAITNLQIKIEEYAVYFLPLHDTPDILQTRTYPVPPGFFQGGLSTKISAFGSSASTTVKSVSADVKKELKEKGVRFQAPGATAVFLPASNRLVAKNTLEQLDRIQALIEAEAESKMPQVEIETKFAEFTDDSLRALYFQYYLSVESSVAPSPGGVPALFPFSYNPALLGLNQSSLKTSGQSALRTAVTQTTGATIQQNAFAGLRANSINNLLRQNSAAAAPRNWLTGGPLSINDFNTFAIGAVIHGKGLQAVAQLIDNMQGVDLLSAPKVTTKNRTPAKIEVIQELRYPTEFERPEINPEVFRIFDNNLSNPPPFPPGQSDVFVALPATPREFAIRPIGVTLEVTPTTYPDQRIDLEIHPEVVDFEGFINYGQDITQLTNNFQGINTVATSVANGIVNQPIFQVRSMSTKLQVLDGQTVVMGGLIREDRQEVFDKVPGLGDLPLIGRLFQSKVKKSIKRNLIIFVTARLVKPNGEPLYPHAAENEKRERPPFPLDLPAPSQISPPPRTTKPSQPFRPTSASSKRIGRL